MPSNIEAKFEALSDALEMVEDAIEADNKLAAREGLIKIARDTDFGDAQFWVRINSLDSPWVLDDLIQIVQRQAPGTWLPLKVRRSGEDIEIVAKFPTKFESPE